MLNVYKFSTDVVCPIDGQTIPTGVVVRSSMILLVEDLLRICAGIVTSQPMLQEGFTEALKQELSSRWPDAKVSVDTQAMHSGVEIICRV
jgi:hypothetical protein